MVPLKWFSLTYMFSGIYIYIYIFCLQFLVLLCSAYVLTILNGNWLIRQPVWSSQFFTEGIFHKFLYAPVSCWLPFYGPIMYVQMEWPNSQLFWFVPSSIEGIFLDTIYMQQSICGFRFLEIIHSVKERGWSENLFNQSIFPWRYFLDFICTVYL